MKRAAAILLAVLLVAGLFPASAFAETVYLLPGRYVRLGSYMGQPLIWRCVGSDENGLLMLCEKIICFKAYSSGDSRWSDSWLRQWLNSDATSVTWAGDPPDPGHADGNAYADESGFLSGFAPDERKLIVPATNKSVLNETDIAAADSGTAVHLYNSSGQVLKSVQNYDEAYSLTTTDLVFCPNITQMELVMANYPTEFTTEPTQTALNQTGNIKNFESLSNSYYWLRDSLGNGDFTEAVRCIYPDGRILFADAFESYIGVRPALYLAEKFPAVSGSGYRNDPYAVSDEILSAPLPVGSPVADSGRLSAQGPYASITEGDYLVMGNYNGGEILWRCVDINENGPLMLSDRILSFKSFDASGSHGVADRNKYGSNNWALSNIRSWLNSLEGEGQKVWPCGNAPTSDKCEGYNGYSAEKGFLTGFAPEERALMRTVNIRTVINPIDADENTVGTEPLIFLRNVNLESNYASAYSAYTWDTVFLLSIQEAAQVKQDFGNFLTASPTAASLNLNEASIDGLSSDRSAVWWLRDADANVDCNVRAVTLDGWIHSIAAVRSSNGIRPAFYLNMDAATFLSGDGSRDEPYRVEGHSYGEWTQVLAPRCTEPGIRRQTCLTCGESRDESIPARGHRFGAKVVVSRSLSGTVLSAKCSHCGEIYTEKKAALWPVFVGAAAVIAAMAWQFIRKKRNDRDGT